MILTRPGKATSEEMLEKNAIKELLEFERFARDNDLWEEMKKCYSKESVVDISWYTGSGEGFIDASAALGMRGPHKIYNTQIWLNGNKAVALMMATIQLRYEIDGIEVELQSDSKLVFQVEKQNGLWMIAAFTSIYEQDRMIPVYPNNQLIIPKDQLGDFRSSYACMSYMNYKNGRPINNDLPGIDRPDLVEKLYQDLDKWLSR